MVKIHFLGRKIAKRRFQPFLPIRRNLNRVRSVFPPWCLVLFNDFVCWLLATVAGNYLALPFESNGKYSNEKLRDSADLLILKTAG